LNAVLKYPGAKWKISKWIISQFPKHHTYIEPYFGSGAVFFNKQPSPIETINDLDNKVTTLFEIIRNEPEELAKLIAATPFSRSEYDFTFENLVPDDKYEQTRRFLVQCWQGHGFRTNGNKVGWKNDVQGREKAYALSNWYRLPGWIIEASDRLKQAQIECRPALEVIKRHRYPNVLIYADPPYVLQSRSGGKIYKHEMTDQDQLELLETLMKHPGPVILSGYRNQLYDETLKGWHTESTKGYAEYIGADRVEVIWMNFSAGASQLSLL